MFPTKSRSIFSVRFCFSVQPTCYKVIGLPINKKTKELLCFRVLDRHLAISTSNTREVFALSNITSLPLTPPLLVGLTNLRGSALPVFDLAGLWRNESREIKLLESRCIAIEDGTQVIALLADKIEEILAISEIHKLPAADEISEFMFQKDGRQIAEIDLEKLLHMATVVMKRELRRKGVSVG